jgi:hypothetical protein
VDYPLEIDRTDAETQAEAPASGRRGGAGYADEPCRRQWRGKIDDAPHPGRPRATTRRKGRVLLRLAKAQASLSSVQSGVLQSCHARAEPSIVCRSVWSELLRARRRCDAVL